MAKFVEEKEIINSHINDYIDRVTDFSKYIQGSPSFVTYYGKDLDKSTEDIGLQGVYETTGMESPLQYKQINNFPIYNFEEISVNTNFDEETGLQTDIEGSGIILPNTLKPYIGDRFVISYVERGDLLFVVSNVEIGNLANKVYYKISFHHVVNGNTEMPEENISKTYQTLYNNIGKDEQIMVEQDIYKIISDIKDLDDKIRDYYIKRYYKEDLNMFIYGNSVSYRYDNYLAKFCNNTNIFIRKHTFMDNLMIEPWQNDEVIEEIYDMSLWYTIEHKEFCDLRNFHIFGTTIAGMRAGAVPHMYSYKYKDLMIMDYIGTHDIEGNISFNNCPLNTKNWQISDEDTDFLFDPDFIEKIKTNTLYTEKEKMIENVIILYLNEYDDKKLLIYILENLKCFKVRNYQQYLLTVMILYIIRETVEFVKTNY